MSDQLVREWDTKINHIAGYWVNQWACRQDRLPLIADVQAAGWCALLTFGPDHPRVLWEIQNQCQETISLWLYGVGRRSRQWERRISICYDNELPPQQYHRADHSDVETTALRRLGLQRLWHRLARNKRAKGQAVLCLMIDNWPAIKMARGAGAAANVSFRLVFDGKRRIRRMAAVLGLNE